MQQQSTQTRRWLVGTVAAVALSALPLFAHHGWEGYRTEEFEISGIVEQSVETSGPHATMKIRTDGQVWNVVLAPSPRTVRAGLTSGLIPLGETVTAHGHRHKDAKVFEVKTERLRWKDKEFNVYPDRS